MTIADLVNNTEPWMAQAACRQHPPDTFYPLPTDIHTQAAAKRICATCPVQTYCLKYALEHDEPHGIWGGLTPRERRNLQRDGRPPTITAQCGTTTGAHQHYRRDEPCCPACRTAASRARRNQRAQKPQKPRNTAAPTPTGKCGNEAGAKQHAYRGEQTCNPCREASTRARRRRLGISA